MATAAAECGNCGLAFPANPVVFHGSGPATFVMTHAAVDCPRCGGIARVADFTRTSDEHGVTVTPHTERDAEVMRRVGLLVQELVHTGATEDEIVEAVEKESPEAAKRLSGKTRQQMGRQAAKYIAVAAMILSDDVRGWAVGKGMDELLDLVQRTPAVTQTIDPVPPAPSVNLPEIGPGSRGTIIMRPDGSMEMQWYPAPVPPSPPSPPSPTDLPTPE